MIVSLTAREKQEKLLINEPHHHLDENDRVKMKYENGLDNCNTGASQSEQPGTSANGKSRICRDFVRGTCRRKHCRYPHVLATDAVVFCHDFQNTYCPRVNCKFLHYTMEEAEHYKRFGEFPPTDDKETPPPPQQRFNRDFRFRREELPPPPPPLAPSSSADRMQQMGYRPSFNDPFMNHRDYPPQRGNRNERDDFGIKRPSSDRYDEGFKRFRDDNEQPDVMAIIRKFEEEQAMLRRRVEANEIKIAELRASNEYLIAQNAQLRLNTVQVSRVVSTVTNTTPQQAAQAQPTQVINAVSMAPVQVATPIVSMATQQQSAILGKTSEQPLPNFRISNLNFCHTHTHTPTGNGPQALAIATNTTTGEQQLTTIATQPQLNTSTQQLAPLNQITLTPTLTAAPLAINTSQALAMSNATQPIISYPVMTHSILPH